MCFESGVFTICIALSALPTAYGGPPFPVSWEGTLGSYVNKNRSSSSEKDRFFYSFPSLIVSTDIPMPTAKTMTLTILISVNGSDVIAVPNTTPATA